MSHEENKKISIVVPVFNELESIEHFHKELIEVLSGIKVDYEVLYVNDGSTDGSLSILSGLAGGRIKLISLSRNFGKEIDLSAGISNSNSDAVITIDSDGQHPPKLIAQFIENWEKGSKVVVGVRSGKSSKSLIGNLNSFLFYKLFNFLSSTKTVPGSTDYRLIDQSVVEEFVDLGEQDRMTRQLIDWLGFDHHYIYFNAKEREFGTPAYSTKKLIDLAFSAMISSSPKPLYLFANIGIGITGLSFILGLSILIEQLIFGDPLNWNFTGTAMLGIMIIFLVGIVLMSQGIISMYISRIYNQSKGRPLYVIDRSKSIGISPKKIS